MKSSAKYHRIDRDPDDDGRGSATERAYKYVRPTGATADMPATKHLFVSGAKTWIHEFHAVVSSPVGAGEDDEQTRTPLGNVTHITDVFNDSHFYVSFPSAEDARAGASVVASMNDTWLAPRFAAWRLEAAALEAAAFRGMDPEEVARAVRRRDRQPRIVTQYADMVEVKRKRVCRIAVARLSLPSVTCRRLGRTTRGGRRGTSVCVISRV